MQFKRIGVVALLAAAVACPARGAGQAEQHPFPDRFPAPEFPKDLQWINTSGPLPLRSLRGKFVLLDFWTYCCINCIHILPELKKLERAYPDQLVVIGVHSAKFQAEQDSRNIEEAVLRYEIEHPVVNDSERRIWNRYQVDTWPTIRIIDPQGNFIAGAKGEFKFETVDQFFKRAIPYYRENGLLDESPIRFDLAARKAPPTPLRFPGKVLADPDGDRLFISDSNHNRIVIASLAGQLQEIVGSGGMGRDDGDYRTATFDHPQGMALAGDWLYVADTENHLIRKVDLIEKTVATVAGTGEQSTWPFPGTTANRRERLPPRVEGASRRTALNSPWALWAHGQYLYIAMAGSHQIWKMGLDEQRVGLHAGNGLEDIVDGRLLPDYPYTASAAPQDSFSAFAQPSGLTGDETWLYVADSEGSSIRAVPYSREGHVKTVVGTAGLPRARLFTFGDRDGSRERVLLQHALGVACRDGKIYVADTYNNKVKVIDALSGTTQTLAGTGVPGSDDDKPTFDEPSGLTLAGQTLYVADTNNHSIRTIDLSTGRVTTLTIQGLDPPAPSADPPRPDFRDADSVAVGEAQVKPTDGRIELDVRIELPAGWKMNPAAPQRYFLEAEGEGPVTASGLGWKEVTPPAARFTAVLPVTGQGAQTVRLGMEYYYCSDDGSGLCKIGRVQFVVPLTVGEVGRPEPVQLRHATR